MDKKRHKTDDCSSVCDQLSPFFDGELDHKEMRCIEDHLRNCPECREEFELLGNLSKYLRVEGQKTPEPPVWTALEERIPIEKEVPKRYAFRKKSRISDGEANLTTGLSIWYRRFGYAAGLILIFTVTGYFLGINRGPDNARKETPREIAKTVPEPTAFALNPRHSLGDNLINLLQSQEEKSSGFKEFLAFSQAKEADVETLESQAGFKITVSEELPRGFEFDKCYILNSICCSSVYSSYNNGLEVISVFQQAPGHPFASNFNAYKNKDIGGVPCRVMEVNGFEVVQVNRERKNLLIVARQNVLDGEILTAALTSTGSH